MMRINVKHRTAKRVKRRAKVKARIRRKITGTLERPRVTLFRSNRFLYIQCVDDTQRHTLLGMNSKNEASFKGKNTVDQAKAFGKLFGEKLVAKGVKRCLFDRSGYLYHGRVKALAEGLRESGIQM